MHQLCVEALYTIHQYAVQFARVVAHFPYYRIENLLTLTGGPCHRFPKIAYAVRIIWKVATWCRGRAKRTGIWILDRARESWSRRVVWLMSVVI